MKNIKRNITIAAVLLLVCAAVYLNWSYNNRWGVADTAMVKAEDAAMQKANEAYEASKIDKSSSGYFAQARLNRQVSREEASKLLEQAVKKDGASKDAVDSAMKEIETMANYSMSETNLESKIIAKNFADCVVYMTEDKITVSVPAPKEGLTKEQVARITETVTAETDYTAAQLNIIEISA